MPDNYKLRVQLNCDLNFKDGGFIPAGTYGYANQLCAYACNAFFDGHKHGVLCLTAWLSRVKTPEQLPLFAKGIAE